MKVFERVRKKSPRLAKVWADANYRAAWIAANRKWVLADEARSLF